MLSENLPNLETKQMFGLIFVSGVLLTAAWCLNRCRKELQQLVARAPRGHGQAMQAGNSHSSAAKYLANDCDLSDKLFHACQDVVCAQSDKQGHAVITNH